MNLTCNATLEELRILPGSEIQIVGPLTFHELALIIAGSCTIIAICLSLYLIWMHALHYTKPREQRHIIRILFMVPVYAASSFLQLWFYWHAIYFQVLSDCYEAFAIASFFALLCHYLAPDLHEQKQFFRDLYPIKKWVWPLNWFAKCCGGERGPWRTPKSGLTWFNIIWIGVYHYCFVRVAMTITAVVTQYFHRYCESSNNPVFGHVWVISINCLAVTVAMYCIIQFYVQLRERLAEHKPFLKVLAIKLVVFFSFWQATAISLGTSTLDLVHANEVLAYPDIKVGIPALLLCFEMAIFAALHLWAFPYAPYRADAKPTFYPAPDARRGDRQRENEHTAPSGGFLGLGAILDALNLWDFVKAFGRGMRWLFCGIKRRKEDASYKNSAGLNMDDLGKGDETAGSSYGVRQTGPRGTEHLPIANEFRRSAFLQSHNLAPAPEERIGLIAHAQPNPMATAGAQSPPRDTRPAFSPYRDQTSTDGRDPRLYRPEYGQQSHDRWQGGASNGSPPPRPPRDPAQLEVGRALWGGRDGPAPGQAI